MYLLLAHVGSPLCRTRNCGSIARAKRDNCSAAILSSFCAMIVNCRYMQRQSMRCCSLRAGQLQQSLLTQSVVTLCIHADAACSLTYKCIIIIIILIIILIIIIIIILMLLIILILELTLISTTCHHITPHQSNVIPFNCPMLLARVHPPAQSNRLCRRLSYVGSF